METRKLSSYVQREPMPIVTLGSLPGCGVAVFAAAICSGLGQVSINEPASHAPWDGTRAREGLVSLLSSVEWMEKGMVDCIHSVFMLQRV